LSNAEAKLQSLQTPHDVCNRTIQMEDDLQYSTNKTRREIERELKAIYSLHANLKKDMEIVRAVTAINTELHDKHSTLDNMRYYIEDNITKVCDILEMSGFIEKNVENEYGLTPSGRTASGIAEVHSIVATHVLLKHKWFCELGVEQIIGFLACFTDVNVAKDSQHHSPHTSDSALKEAIVQLETTFREYEQMELDRKIYTGHNYDDPICFDMPDLAVGWCYCTNEVECKRFIQNDVALLGISVGDFTKALLKISTIAREWMVVAEVACETACAHKLSQVDSTILKYVTTAQSLYV